MNERKNNETNAMLRAAMETCELLERVAYKCELLTMFIGLTILIALNVFTLDLVGVINFKEICREVSNFYITTVAKYNALNFGAKIYALWVIIMNFYMVFIIIYLLIRGIVSCKSNSLEEYRKKMHGVKF